MKNQYFLIVNPIVARVTMLFVSMVIRFVNYCNLFFNHSFHKQYDSKVSFMRNASYIVAGLSIAICLWSCKKEISNGLPDNLINTKPDSVLIAKQTALFKEGKTVSDQYPILFDTTREIKLILKEDANVYITFLHEGANWTNSFGYYTYMKSDPPSITNKKILFPNISGAGEGGGLQPGDMVQVGNGILPKGTVIGFFLVAQGWDSDKGKIVDGIYTTFTDNKLNTNKYQQSIFFIEKTTGKLVVGFEDMLLNNPEADGDYNDIVLSVSDSKDPASVPAAFDLSAIPIL